ncbi:hypothetical protein Hte_010537 [Hypoxylon texense]
MTNGNIGFTITSTMPRGNGGEREVTSNADPMSKKLETGEPPARSNRAAKEKQDRDEKKIKLGETVLGAITTLTRETDDIYDDSSDDLSTDLKVQLRRLRKLGKRFVESTKTTDDDGWKYVCEVLRLPMDEWLKKGWNDKNPPLHVIKAYYRSVPAHTQAGEEQGGQVQDQALGSEKPLRVMINSKPLIHSLEEITGTGLDYQYLVVSSPYKLFSHAWPQIKPYLAKLRTQHAEMTNVIKSDKSSRLTETNVHRSLRATSSTTADHQEDENKTSIDTASKKTDVKVLAMRIEHLELLSTFIATDLGYIIELRRRIQESTLKSIEFEDLWHLFSPGDTLYTKENDHEQLYTAYMVTGGKKRLRNATREELDEIRSAQRNEKWYRRRSDSSESESEEDDRNRIHAANKGSWTAFVIDCYRMAYDGNCMGPIDSLKKIQHFVGQKRITDLHIYPLRFHGRQNEITKLLEERGRMFIHCNGHRSYDGLVFDRRGRPTKEELHGDVYVDFEEYYRSIKRWRRPKLGKLRLSQPTGAEVTEQDTFSSRIRPDLIELVDYKVDELRTHNFLSEKTWTRDLYKPYEVLEMPQLLVLFPYWVVGFAYRNRSWTHLDVNYVKGIDKSDESRKTGFEELVIPEQYRTLLVSLVESHSSGTRGKIDTSELNSSEEPIRQIDLVRGKGLGLIILLHGPPGSGKTSTAETIAAYTGRPLYIITCGDLGLTPQDVEKTLAEHTRRADKWGCVLLLDEADVFLVKRDWKDMGRNALVAVFLRQLEYYAGILFLTTNRVGVLDEAFKSRIHISLRYPKIERKQTRKIWKNVLDRLERDNEHREVQIKFNREKLLKYAKTQFEKLRESESTWNGRQIRNAFQTAIALAEYDRSNKLQDEGLTPEEALRTGERTWRRLDLKVEYFDIVANTAQEFEDYLDSIFGQKGMERTFDEDLRNDYYDPRDYPVLPRQDNPNRAAGYNQNPTRSSATQQLHLGTKPLSADTSTSRVRSIKGKSHPIEQTSAESSEDSTSEGDNKKKRRRGKQKRLSKSSDPESD